MNSNSFQKKVLQGSFIAVFFSLVGSVFAYLIKVFYSRTLSIDDYSLFYAVFGFFILVSTYTELGFGEAMSYFIPKHFKNEKYQDLLNTLVYGQLIQIIVAIVLSIAIWFLAPLLAISYFKVSGSENLIHIFCFFLILISVLNGLLQIFTGLQKAKHYSSIYIIRNGIILFSSFIFLALGLNNIYYYALTWIIGYLITSIIFFYLLWLNHSFLNYKKISWDKKILISMYKYALPAFTTTFIYTLITSSDIFFLTLFRGIKDVGTYSILIPIASIPLIFLVPLNNVLLPLTSHLMEGEKKRLTFLLDKIYQLIPFVGLYFALFIILFPSIIIGLIFGNKWIGLAQPFLPFMAFGYIALLVSTILGIITLGIGKVQERLKALLLMSVFNIVFHSILVFKFGIFGAIITNSLTGLLLCLLYTRMIKSSVSFRLPYIFYLQLLIFILVIFLVVKITGIYPKNLLDFIGFGVIYSIFFASFGYFVKLYDKKLITMMIPKI